MHRRTLRLLLTLGFASCLLSFTIASDPARPDAVDHPESELESIYGEFDSLMTDLSEYAWPLDENLSTTSVFADFRPTHFHAGVDISTRGREGYPVKAMRAGYVSLVRVSSSGYGKAMEVTHKDGFTTWYAHLQRYAPAIDSAVKALQRSQGRYQATLRPGRKRFPVSQGDVIAFTGSTGAGGPHLHFEIRDQNGNPANPLLSESFSPFARDNEPPVFEEVGFVPLRASTFIQGNTQPFYLRPIRKGKAEYKLNTIVHATGTLGLTAKVKDAVGRRLYTNRGVELTLEVDSLLVYSSRITRIPSREAKQVALHYDWVARSSGKSHHQNLFIEEGNRLPFYDRLPQGSGILQTDGTGRGYHTYVLTATDVHGNRSRLTGTFVFNHPPEIYVTPGEQRVFVHSDDPTIARFVLEPLAVGGVPSERVVFGSEDVRAPDGDGWSIPYPTGAYEALNVIAENEFGTQSAGYWIPSDIRKHSNSSLQVVTSFYRDYAYVSVSSSLPVTGRPSIKVLSGSIESDLSVRSLTARSFFSSFSLDLFGEHPIRIHASADINGTPDVEGFDEFTIHPILRNKGGTVLSGDGSFRMVFPPRAFFADTYVRLERVKNEFEVQPDDVLLDRGASIEMDGSAQMAGRKAGLFAQRGSDLSLLDWRGAGTGKKLRGRATRFLGTYVVLEDETGPKVGTISLRYSRDWLSGTFRITDSRAGVDATSIRVTVDNKMVIPHYETEGSIVRLGEVIHLSPGKHVIRVTASDNMDNWSARSVPFTTK